MAVGTIHEFRVYSWKGFIGQLQRHDQEGIRMVPVRDEKWSKVDVIVGRCWAMDMDGSCNAIGVL